MKGNLTISRHYGGNEEAPIHIKVRDEISGITFIETSMSLKDFADCLTGRGEVDCEFEFFGLKNVGKKREIKVEKVPFKSDQYVKNGEERNKIARVVLKSYEEDGWVGYVDDLFNYHRRTSDGGQMVNFHRYVDAQTE